MILFIILGILLALVFFISMTVLFKNAVIGCILTIILIAVVVFTVVYIKKRFTKKKSDENKESEKTETPSYKYKPDRIPDNYECKYSYDDVLVAGSKYNDISSVAIKYVCALVPEPENEHDNKAVAVFCRDIKIGYLPNNKLKEMYHDFKARGDSVYASISKIDDENVYIELSFYSPIDISSLKRRGAKCFKLTNIGSEEIQGNISVCAVGDKVEYDYDFEKEKYSASAGLDIGFFPKSANKYLENSPEVFIESIDEDDNGKYTVSVLIKE